MQTTQLTTTPSGGPEEDHINMRIRHPGSKAQDKTRLIPEIMFCRIHMPMWSSFRPLLYRCHEPGGRIAQWMVAPPPPRSHRRQTGIWSARGIVDLVSVISVDL